MHATSSNQPQSTGDSVYRLIRCTIYVALHHFAAVSSNHVSHVDLRRSCHTYCSHMDHSPPVHPITSVFNLFLAHFPVCVRTCLCEHACEIECVDWRDDFKLTLHNCFQNCPFHNRTCKCCASLPPKDGNEIPSCKMHDLTVYTDSPVQIYSKMIILCV